MTLLLRPPSLNLDVRHVCTYKCRGEETYRASALRSCSAMLKGAANVFIIGLRYRCDLFPGGSRRMEALQECLRIPVSCLFPLLPADGTLA